MSGTKGRFRPVYVDHKKKIISLREKKWRFEFSQSDLRKFFGKGFHKVSITGVLIVSILVMSTTFPSEAQTTTFFAGTCLGEWETTKNVIGEAQVHDSSPEWFSSNNSALSRGKPVSMYCGDFQGNVPDKGIVGKATLSFSLFVGDEYIDEEMVVHATSTNWAEFVRQKETSVDTYVESGSVNLVNATSGEAMTVAGDGDMFDEGQTATSGDDMSSEEESTTTFSEEELTETVEDEDTEAVTVESNDFMDSFWDILDAPEGAEVSFTLTEEIETGGTATTVIEGIDLEQDLYDIIDAPADSTVEYHIEDVMDSVDQEEPELVVEQEVLPVEEVPVEEPI
ncbi:MAG: hypothetical protein KAS07_01690, partial [Candidatus Pacebacteria bacterium]|nr:hypothetical protein [Candidatus Paceibacterota bacterium]